MQYLASLSKERRGRRKLILAILRFSGSVLSHTRSFVGHEKHLKMNGTLYKGYNLRF